MPQRSPLVSLTLSSAKSGFVTEAFCGDPIINDPSIDPAILKFK
jgi:hypothetical protein